MGAELLLVLHDTDGLLHDTMH